MVITLTIKTAPLVRFDGDNFNEVYSKKMAASSTMLTKKKEKYYFVKFYYELKVIR